MNAVVRQRRPKRPISPAHPRCAETRRLPDFIRPPQARQDVPFRGLIAGEGDTGVLAVRRETE